MVCTDAVIIASQRVSVRISDVASYAATLNWKLYLLMTPTSAYTTVWDNGSTQYNSSFNSTLRATALCTADTSNFISVASSNVTDIQLNNTFILMADSSQLALAELLIVYSKCSHKTCRRCSSATNCTLCFDATLFKQLGSCVTACSSQYYTFADEMQCYSKCPTGTYAEEATVSCVKCTSPCLQCTSASTCLACSTNYFLYNSSCLNSCPSGFYANNQSKSC
jgi:hypothetical protein